MRPLSFLTALAALAITACAYVPGVQLDAAQHNSLNNKTFSVVTHREINARVQTMGKTMMFGELAGPYYASQGQKLIRENNLPDPAVATATQIAASLTQRFGMQQVGTPGKLYNGDEPMGGVEADPADLLADYPEGDYLLDTDSLQWWMVYNIIDGYNVIYQSYTRLIDRKTGAVIAARPCVFSANADEDDHPSYDELLADKAARMKQYFTRASAKCSTEFILQLSPKAS
jgi:hypothetical protein